MALAEVDGVGVLPSGACLEVVAVASTELHEGVVLVLVLLLVPVHRLEAGSQTGADHVVPVLRRAGRLFHETLDEEDAGVADLAGPLLLEGEAPGEDVLVLLAVREPGAAKISVKLLLFLIF